MTTYALLHTIFFFFVYAFLGWCVEVAYAAITTRELVNRGFLNGPICPIYGCGMTVMIAVLGRFTMPSSDMAWYQNGDHYRLGKPNLLYVKDLYAGLSQSNYWKYENHTSGGMKNELPGVPKSNGSNTEKINKTDNSETDLIYPAELQEEERYRHYFKEKLELSIMEQNYPMDKAVLHEILELLVETVTSKKKFLRICGEEKPREVVKSRLMKLDSSHIQYILECLKENSTQIRNIKQYLLATLYNAPVTVDSYYSAQVRHEFGWGGRVDKN